MKPESPQQEKRIGRPSDYSDALADAICDRLILGESMAAICREESQPSETTVYRWLQDEDGAYFRERLARAREIQADRMAAEIIAIVDDASRDVVEVVVGYDEDNDRDITRTTERFTATSRDKLKVDARFKLMALLAPKKYGTKLVDMTSGGDKLGATDYTKLSREALAEVLDATRPAAE